MRHGAARPQAVECAVDWLKHCFLTKFNKLSPTVYGNPYPYPLNASPYFLNASPYFRTYPYEL